MADPLSTLVDDRINTPSADLRHSGDFQPGSIHQCHPPLRKTRVSLRQT